MVPLDRQPSAPLGLKKRRRAGAVALAWLLAGLSAGCVAPPPPPPAAIVAPPPEGPPPAPDPPARPVALRWSFTVADHACRAIAESGAVTLAMVIQDAPPEPAAAGGTTTASAAAAAGPPNPSAGMLTLTMQSRRRDAAWPRAGTPVTLQFSGTAGVWQLQGTVRSPRTVVVVRPFDAESLSYVLSLLDGGRLDVPRLRRAVPVLTVPPAGAAGADWFHCPQARLGKA